MASPAAHNVDEILFSLPPNPVVAEVPQSEPTEPTQDNLSSTEPEIQETNSLDSDTQDTREPEEPREPEQEVTEKSTKTQNNTDEYGNEIKEKPSKVYTEEEVQKMIRDRVARERKHQEQESIPVTAQSAQSAESANGEEWEQQLEQFIGNTLTKREQQAKEQQWRHEADRQQQEFETKFNNSALRYNDFEDVVLNKPLTQQMVMATRGMNDPAAFIYAAAKTQAHELERISKLTDPLHVGVELGKLEERMKKARANTSSAPKPNVAITGDTGSRTNKGLSLDERIRQDAEKHLRKK